jgi:pimeloyl-ACP methyl ester carboxylesterase
MASPRMFRLPVGDVELAVHEWPGQGDPVLLLHATGFHSRCWNQVVKQLPNRHVYAVDLRFHGGSDATGKVDWQVMTEDIRALIRRLELTNLVGVGHSIGGYLIARAAAHETQRFRHLVLIDPIIMPAQRYAEFEHVPEDAARTHPVSRRKNQWRDAHEMHERFKERAPFNTWQPEVLRDYCDYALLPPDENGLCRLACNPLHEAGIYVNQRGNTIVLEELSCVTMPVTLLRAPFGSDGRPDLSVSHTWPGLAAALPDCREVYLPAMNHFIPMQDPALVAQHILQAQ